MIDEKSGEEEVVEAPTEDIPESESSEEVADQPQPEEAESPETETGENEVDDKPPKDNAAWAAMRTENKRLKEAIKEVDPEYIEKLQSAFSQPQNYPQPQQVPEDAEYGQVTQGLNYAQQQAAQANQRISQLQAQLERQQDAQAEDAYPELRTNKVFQQLVAEKKLAARVLGNDRTTIEIAKEVKRLLDRTVEQTAVATEKAVKQQELEKRAAIAEGKGTSTSGKPKEDDESLKNRVRHGDMEAQSEVAKRIIGDLEF